MEKLLNVQKRRIIKLHFEGCSYQEIAQKVKVSKGSVANVVAEFRKGNLLQIEDTSEQLDSLREIAVELHRSDLKPEQAIAGLAILSHLKKLGISPGDIALWASLCRKLTPPDTDPAPFVKAALYLEKHCRQTGLTPAALEERVKTLEEKSARLKGVSDQLQARLEEMDDLQKRQQGLTDELSQLEKRCAPLRAEVPRLQEREAELACRTEELEGKSHAIAQQLAVGRRDLQGLAKLGLTGGELTGLVQQVAGVSQKHGIPPTDLRNRLFCELQNLEAGLGLESLVEAGEHNLAKVNRAIAESKKERQALKSTLTELGDQHKGLQMMIAEEEIYLQQTMQGLAQVATDAVVELKSDMRKRMDEALLEIQNLQSETLKLGKKMGQIDDVIKSRQWLQVMMRLINGDGDISPVEVKAVVSLVLRGFTNWLPGKDVSDSSPYLTKSYTERLIEEISKWKVSPTSKSK